MISRNKAESKKGILLSGEKCIVCGWYEKNYKGESLVVGAHVRPFESGEEYDKYNNIIALCPNHHAEYDGFVFTIDSETRTLLFRDPSNPYHGTSVKNKVKHIDARNLAYNQYLFNHAYKS